MSIEPDIENLGELPRVPGVPGVFRLPDGSVVSEDYVLLARIASALERIAGALEGKNTWKEWAGKAQAPKKSIWPQVLAKFTAEERNWGDSAQSSAEPKNTDKSDSSKDLG